MAANPLVIGAVIYDPKVTIIWNIIREYFEEKGFPVDVIFYRTYEMQTKALAEKHVDMAWNSPLAWLDTVRLTKGKCRALAMRDTDQDRVSHVVVKKDGPKSVKDLKGKTVAFGAKDSPQATLIPMVHLEKEGLKADKDYKVKRFDVLVGLHGDHIGGELDAWKCLDKGEADASVMLDLNWDKWSSDGTIPKDKYRVLTTTGKFDHCVFAVREDFPKDREKAFLKALFGMSYDNPKHREMMDMEGLKEWRPARTTGFAQLEQAVEKTNFFGEGKKK